MKETKKINSNRILKTFFIVIIIYLIFRTIPLPFGKNSKTIRPKVSTHMNSFETMGVIIKDEKTYFSANKGNLEIFVEEGQRAPAGSKVSVLTSLDGATGIEDELEQINKSISEIQNIKLDKEALESGTKEEIVDNLKSKIQSEIIKGKFDKIYILREQLSTIVTGETGEGSKASDNTLNQLESRREELFKSLHENVKDYYIDNAAMISYKIDGYEEIYTPEDFEKYTYEFLDKNMSDDKKQMINIKTKTVVETSKPMFKVLDNFHWFLAIKIDDSKVIKNLENKKTMKVKLNDKNEELEGKIIKINKFKNKAVIILEFKSKLQNYYVERFPKIEVIESNTLGYKIPKIALIEKENIKGVIAKDISNIARFRPITILAEDKESYYVKMGDENGYLRNDDGETIRTINLFDEIFIRPKGIKDGKILD